MTAKWWLATLIFPIVLAIAGAIIAYVRYRLELREYYGKELFEAGSGLLFALHLLNNAHQGREDHSDEAAFLAKARAARDEVWRHQSQLRLISSLHLREAVDSLVEEYMSSSPGRKDFKSIDRQERLARRNEFEQRWRQKCPGFPGNGGGAV